MVLDFTMLMVWSLRIVLPIMFFAIYFRLQASPKLTKSAEPPKNVLSRRQLLLLRKAVQGCPPPETMKNIALKDQTQAPHLFSGSGRAPRPERSRRAPDESGERAPRAERAEKRERREKREKKEPEIAPGTVSLSEEKMHLESLLNYVAFNRQEEQRAFLPAVAEGDPPPPPGEEVPRRRAESNMMSGATAEKANSDARMVLQGAIAVKRPDVAKLLHDQLIEAHVEMTEATFELMIDACLLAKDLKGASDFLMKLENAGFSPSSQLLDKVLDLYTQQQAEAEHDKLAKADSEIQLDTEVALSPLLPGAAATADPTIDEAPMAAWGMPMAPMMPMFNWDAIDSGSDDDDGDAPAESTKLSTDAPVFVPSFIPGPPPLAGTELLSATAQPFEPHTFEPAMYNTWMSSSWEEPDGESRQTEKGKGNSKGKGKGKWSWSNADWDAGWHSRSGGSKGEWDDGWHGKSSGGKDEWKQSRVEDKVEKTPQEEDKTAHSKETRSWKKAEMKWRPKAES